MLASFSWARTANLRGADVESAAPQEPRLTFWYVPGGRRVESDQLRPRNCCKSRAASLLQRVSALEQAAQVRDRSTQILVRFTGAPSVTPEMYNETMKYLDQGVRDALLGTGRCSSSEMYCEEVRRGHPWPS
jgi:hypothetical protein